MHASRSGHLQCLISVLYLFGQMVCHLFFSLVLICCCIARGGFFLDSAKYELIKLYIYPALNAPLDHEHHHRLLFCWEKKSWTSWLLTCCSKKGWAAEKSSKKGENRKENSWEAEACIPASVLLRYFWRLWSVSRLICKMLLRIWLHVGSVLSWVLWYVDQYAWLRTRRILISLCWFSFSSFGGALASASTSWESFLNARWWLPV